MSKIDTPNRTFLIGAAFLALSLGITLFWYLGYGRSVIEGEGRELRAEFSSVPQLQTNDPVRVDGKEEGRVREIEDLDGGRGARVTFDVADDAGPIYRDAVVQLRWKNLLGGSFYLEVDRGTPRAGDLGDHVIPRSQTVRQVELDDVITALKGDALGGFVRMPAELDDAFQERRALPRLLDAVADVSPALASGLRALRGQRPDADLRGFIRGTADTVSALDAPRDDMRRLVAGAGATLSTTAEREAELRSTLEKGPGVMSAVRTTLARLDITLAGADDLVGRLQKSAADVAPTLSALRPTLRSTSRLLARARPLVRHLRPAARALRSLGRNGLPLLEALQPSLDRLDQKILPYLARPDEITGKPTSAMIGGTAAGFGGSAGQQDDNGHFMRFPASLGASSVYIPCKSLLADPTAAEMLTCDSLDKALRTYLEYVPGMPGRSGGTSR